MNWATARPKTNSDGTVRESSISIGKRLSRRLYLSYERVCLALWARCLSSTIFRAALPCARKPTKRPAPWMSSYARRYQSLLPAKRAALNAAAERERQAEIDADAARKQSKANEQKISTKSAIKAAKPA